jgi:retron-type reverse transcriptase
MEELNHIETTEGTPQGGIISPTLCNVALKGVEKAIGKANPNKRGISRSTCNPIRGRSNYH